MWIDRWFAKVELPFRWIGRIFKAMATRHDPARVVSLSIKGCPLCDYSRQGIAPETACPECGAIFGADDLFVQTESTPRYDSGSLAGAIFFTALIARGVVEHLVRPTRHGLLGVGLTAVGLSVLFIWLHRRVRRHFWLCESGIDRVRRRQRSQLASWLEVQRLVRVDVDQGASRGYELHVHREQDHHPIRFLCGDDPQIARQIADRAESLWQRALARRDDVAQQV